MKNYVWVQNVANKKYITTLEIEIPYINIVKHYPEYIKQDKITIEQRIIKKINEIITNIVYSTKETLNDDIFNLANTMAENNKRGVGNYVIKNNDITIPKFFTVYNTSLIGKNEIIIVATNRLSISRNTDNLYEGFYVDNNRFGDSGIIYSYYENNDGYYDNIFSSKNAHWYYTKIIIKE